MKVPHTRDALRSGSQLPDASKPDAARPAPPAIALPKDGGAIRGIGEKFTANPVTGTGALTVPIAASSGRLGFGPELSLAYDSGAGNGPFGVGWSLRLPQITRKTDKGIPRYLDHEHSDVFILSGSEDLVPVLDAGGAPLADDTTAPGYVIHRYRPRVEGLFARTERWTRASDGDTHWRSLTGDNVLTVYGKDASARIADPGDPRRVFTWLLCERRDDKGNAALYDYKAEDGAGVDLGAAHEQTRGDRSDLRRAVNRYLKRVRYGNRVPLLDETGARPRTLTDAQIVDAGWMFELVFDYGEHDADAPAPGDPGIWSSRRDPWSSYRAGFEVRTRRLCRRALMFHHFSDEPGVGSDCLVRSTDFTYSDDLEPADPRAPIMTYLRRVTHSGYVRRDAGYVQRSLPANEYEYTRPVVQDTVGEIDRASLANLPGGFDASVRWTDLHGEGIPGLLAEHAARGSTSATSARSARVPSSSRRWCRSPCSRTWRSRAASRTRDGCRRSLRTAGRIDGVRGATRSGARACVASGGPGDGDRVSMIGSCRRTASGASRVRRNLARNFGHLFETIYVE